MTLRLDHPQAPATAPVGGTSPRVPSPLNPCRPIGRQGERIRAKALTFFVALRFHCSLCYALPIAGLLLRRASWLGQGPALYLRALSLIAAAPNARWLPSGFLPSVSLRITLRRRLASSALIGPAGLHRRRINHSLLYRAMTAVYNQWL